MNNQLIPVLAGEIAGTPAQLVDARLLHSFLEVGKEYANWIKDRIKQYDFQENQDFISFCQNGQKPQGGRPTKEYHLTLGMAKELSMVEHNEKGKQARRYFIACERERNALFAPVTGPMSLAEFEQRRTDLQASLDVMVTNALSTASVILSGADYLALCNATKPATKLVPSKPYRPWSSEEDKTMIAMKAQGFNNTEIGEQLNRSNGSVRGRMEYLNYTRAIEGSKDGAA